MVLQDAAVRAEKWVRSLIVSAEGTDEARMMRLADEGLPRPVHERLAARDSRGERARPLEAAAVALLDGGVEANTVGEAIGHEGHWFVSFMRLLLLGEREGVWAVGRLKPGASGHLGHVWDALQAEGPSAVLGVYLWKFLNGNPEGSLDEALGLLEEWRSWERRCGTTSPEAIGESETEDDHLTIGPGPSFEDPSAVSDDDPLLAVLMSLNVNHCLGRKSPSGWYQESEQHGPQLFLRTGVPEVETDFFRLLGREGLLLEELDGQRRGPDGFTVLAGRVTFQSVQVVDVAELRRRLGTRFEDLVARYAGPGSSRYQVSLVSGSRSRRSSPAHSCPRCTKPLRRKQGVGTFWVCAGGCGFSVQADESGAPSRPAACERCGGDAYPTFNRRKKTVLMACLHGCKRGSRP